MACCDECADKLLSIHVGYNPHRVIADVLQMQAVQAQGSYRTRRTNGRATRVGFDAEAAAGTAEQYASQTKEGKSLVSKVAEIGETSATGSALGGAIGSVVPGVGTAIGGAIGGAVGAVYGAVDAFGGDVQNLFNPPAFGEDDYTRIKNKCVASGGEVVGGIPPDRYGACRYPDVFNLGRDILSGGDWPFPGSWNLGQPDQTIPDPVVFQRYQGPTCEGVYGVKIPIPPGWGCNPGVGPVPPPPPPVKPPPPKPPFINLPLFSNAHLTQITKVFGLPPPKPSPPIPLARVASTISNAVIAARNGDPNAKAGIAKVVAKAEQAPESFAAQIAFGLEDGAKRQTRANYVFFWLFGDGARAHFAHGG